jgi:hypothetical protein
MRSVLPPAVKGTTTFTGLLGQSCARLAELDANASASSAAANPTILSAVIPCPPVFRGFSSPLAKPADDARNSRRAKQAARSHAGICVDRHHPQPTMAIFHRGVPFAPVKIR